MRSVLQRFASILMLCAVLGCATSRTVMTEDVRTIRSGLAAAGEQAQVGFDTINKLALDQAIERKLESADVKLAESDFPTTVPATAWSNAFGILDAYGAALLSLLDLKRASDTGNALSELVASLNDLTVGGKIPPSLNGLFATFGEALIQARAEKSATAIMRQTDPAFNAVIGGMAKAIGATPQDTDSLQFVVQSNWTNSVLARLENRYLDLKLGDAARRQVLQNYTAAILSRDAQLASLSQLHQLLLALGEVHAAAAYGKSGDALFWIGRLNGWLDDIKFRANAAQKREDGK